MQPRQAVIMLHPHVQRSCAWVPQKPGTPRYREMPGQPKGNRSPDKALEGGTTRSSPSCQAVLIIPIEKKISGIILIH